MILNFVSVVYAVAGEISYLFIEADVSFESFVDGFDYVDHFIAHAVAELFWVLFAFFVEAGGDAGVDADGKARYQICLRNFFTIMNFLWIENISPRQYSNNC